MEVNIVDPNAAPVVLSEAAVTHFNKQVQDNGAIGVKLGLTASGCAGFSYDWQLLYEYFDNEEAHCSKYDNFVFVVDNLSKEYLRGSVVDVEDLGIKGQMLVVNSPKKTAACGCGESVSFEE